MNWEEIYNKQAENKSEIVSVSKRIELLKLLKNKIEQSEALIFEALQKDFKKPPFETYASEILMVYKELNTFTKHLSSWVKPKRKFPALLNFPSSDYIYRDPWGHVLVIAPWNYPFQLAINPIIAAFASGNKVLLKPSEHASHTANLLEHLIATTFTTKEVSVVQGDASIASKLLKKKWDYIFFTGSVQVGKIVAKAAAEQLCPVTLELGGKNPCIVDESANLKIAAKRIVWGKFLNAGQTCIAPDYLLLHESIKDEFIPLLKKEIEAFYAKDPATSKDYARIINASHFQRLVNLLKDEEVIYGGTFIEKENYIQPTLVVLHKVETPLMREEIFGPILPMMSYQKTEEITSIVSANPNPLAFYLFSEKDKEARQLLSTHRFGGGVINDTIVHFLNDRLPFGGVGNSGMGQYHGKYSFETFTREKAIVHRSTRFDIPVKYAPYKDKLSLLQKLKSFIS
jgi:aldehyde dehydrogenase (NAD+)